MKRHSIVLLVCVGVILPLSLQGRESSRGARPAKTAALQEWQYQGETGAANWGKLTARYSRCDNGTRQSPIDIRPSRVSRLPALRFNYRSTPLQLYSNGRSLQINYPRGSLLRIGQRRFELKTIEFHIPSEHRIEGRQADMEIQLVHVDAGGNRLHLAIPVVAGSRRNAMLQRIADYLPASPQDDSTFRFVGINPTFFLPGDRHYYRYSGSLTHPPCSENITWLVMQEPLEVTAALIGQFHRLTGDNSRPIQPVAGRAVTAGR